MCDQRAWYVIKERDMWLRSVKYDLHDIILKLVLRGYWKVGPLRQRRDDDVDGDSDGGDGKGDGDGNNDHDDASFGTFSKFWVFKYARSDRVVR